MTTARNSCRIRPVRAADAGAIADLMNPIITDGGFSAMTGTMTASDQESFIRALPGRSTYLAAIDEATDALLGIQDCLPGQDQPELCDISTFVSLEAHRRGIGTALFTATLTMLEPPGFRKVRAVIRDQNAGARAFYRMLGFVETEREKGKVTARFDLD